MNSNTHLLIKKQPGRGWYICRSGQKIGAAANVVAAMFQASKSMDRVAMGIQLMRGQASTDDLREKMCSMLGAIRMDAEGLAIAQKARAQSHSDVIADIKAGDLAEKKKSDDRECE